MGEAATHVAAIVLSETGQESTAFRSQPDQPLEGYGLASGNDQVCTLTLFLRGARSPAFYHGWAIGDGDPLYLGAFHLGSGGEGSLAGNLSTQGLEQTTGFLVTAGGVLLAGPLVWMVKGIAPPVEPEPTDQQAEPPDEPQEETEAASPQAGSMPEEPAVHPFKLYPQPATPVMARANLAPAHPKAPRSGGVAVLDPDSGTITMALRGLPSPARLGADPATGRSFNAYRAWLRNRQTRSRYPVGLLERTWGDNFHLKVAEGLKLADYDLIIVTAGDRTAAAPNPQAPAVLTGAMPS